MIRDVETTEELGEDYRAPEPDPRLARMGWFAILEVLLAPNCDPLAIAEKPLGPTILVRSLTEDFDKAALSLNLEDWSEVRSFGTVPTVITKEPAGSLFPIGMTVRAHT